MDLSLRYRTACARKQATITCGGVGIPLFSIFNKRKACGEGVGMLHSWRCNKLETRGGRRGLFVKAWAWPSPVDAIMRAAMRAACGGRQWFYVAVWTWALLRTCVAVCVVNMSVAFDCGGTIEVGRRMTVVMPDRNSQCPNYGILFLFPIPSYMACA